jgi:hypothetical protein
LRIVDADHGGTAVARIANQLLAAAAIDSGEAKIDRIAGHFDVANEAAPLRGLTGEVAKSGMVASNFDFGGAVDDNFNGAFPAISAAASDIGPAVEGLSSERAGKSSHRCEFEAKAFSIFTHAS